jgi:hypothetical protein
MKKILKEVAAAYDIKIGGVAWSLSKEVDDVVAFISEAVELMGKIPVKYIGHRDIYVDGCYGTKIKWIKDDPKHGTQLVPEDKAMLMLRHKDVYEKGVREDASEQEPQDPIEEPEIDQISREAVTRMTRKAPIIQFAKVNFSQPLDDRKTVAELQTEAIRMIDQFGMPE